MKKSHPEIKGFSERNLQLMIQFQWEYTGLFENPQRRVAELPEASRTSKIWPQPVAKLEANDSIQSVQDWGETQFGQQAVAQLHRGHNVILSQKLKGNDYFAEMLTQASPEDQNFALLAIAEFDAELSVGIQGENKGEV
jgi:hypothetical protein